MTEQWSILLLSFALGSFPQGLFFSYLGMMFWGHRVPRMWGKLILFASLESAVTLGLFDFLPGALRPIIAIAVYIALMSLIMRELRFRQRVWLGLFVIVFSALSEMLVGFLSISSGLISYEDAIHDPRKLLIFAPIPPLAGGLLGYVLDRKSIHPGKAIFDFLDLGGNKYLSWLLGLFVTNIVFSTLVFIFAMDSRKIAASILMTVTMIIGLCIFLISVRAMARTREAAIRSTQEIYVEDINHMFTAIRGQRHDFLNHVQVIHSFTQMGKYKELERYTKELVGEITEINELLQIGHPALAALIQSKMVQTINSKIDFRYHFEGMEQIKTGIASLDFVKIAGNLIDNAMDEVRDKPAEDRWVEVKGWLDDQSFNMSVRNPSRKLSEEELNLLFVPGYSTKGPIGHSGLGLSIVKERVDHYKGAVDVSSFGSGLGTTFVVKIPLKSATPT